MKEDRNKKPNKNSRIRYDLQNDDESLRQRKTTKDFKRKKQSILEEESWEDWEEQLDKND